MLLICLNIDSKILTKQENELKIKYEKFCHPKKNIYFKKPICFITKKTKNIEKMKILQELPDEYKNIKSRNLSQNLICDKDVEQSNLRTHQDIPRQSVQEIINHSKYKNTNIYEIINKNKYIFTLDKFLEMDKKKENQKSNEKIIKILPEFEQKYNIIEGKFLNSF